MTISYGLQLCVLPIDLAKPYSLTDRWFLQIFYTAQTALAYSVGNVASGLANNSMTALQRAALSPHDPEYHARYVLPPRTIERRMDPATDGESD